MLSTSLIQPVLAKPFASGSSATKTTNIGATSDSQRMNLEDGFPLIFSTLIKDGGKYIDRADMNGILYAISNIGFYALVGGRVAFNQAMSDLIGGYAKGAQLWYVRNGKMILIESQVENNTRNPSGNVDTEVSWEGENKVIWKSVSGYVIDSAMSTVSQNPVQNSVVTARINSVDAGAVHKTGAETVAGVKTFTDYPSVPTVSSGGSPNPSDNSQKAANTSWVNAFWNNVKSTVQVITAKWNFNGGIKTANIEGVGDATESTLTLGDGNLTVKAKGSVEVGSTGSSNHLSVEGTGSFSGKITAGGVCLPSVKGASILATDANGNICQSGASVDMAVVPDWTTPIESPELTDDGKINVLSGKAKLDAVGFTVGATGLYTLTAWQNNASSAFVVYINGHIYHQHHNISNCGCGDVVSIICEKGWRVKFTKRKNNAVYAYKLKRTAI